MNYDVILASTSIHNSIFNNFRRSTVRRWRTRDSFADSIRYQCRLLFPFSFLCARRLSGVSEPSIFVCLKNSRRSTRCGGVMAVLPLKCYLNDKVVWLRGLRGVILYTFTRLHSDPLRSPTSPLFPPLHLVYTGHVSRHPSGRERGPRACARDRSRSRTRVHVYARHVRAIRVATYTPPYNIYRVSRVLHLFFCLTRTPFGSISNDQNRLYAR